MVGRCSVGMYIGEEAAFEGFTTFLGDDRSGEGTFGVVDEIRGDPFKEERAPSDEAALLRGSNKLDAVDFPHGIVGDAISADGGRLGGKEEAACREGGLKGMSITWDGDERFM